MRVTLIDYTGNGRNDAARYAANLLIFTKSTRLNMRPELFNEINAKSNEEILNELKAMARTNPGSWEFISFTFLIEDVTRAFTQQLQRTRHASYAQQTWRIVDISTDFKYEIGPSIKANPLVIGSYKNTMENSAQCYKHLIDAGVKVEDARGVLPINTLTNVMMQIDMRNFINLVRKRSSLRVQNEYRNVKDAMLIEVERVYNWFYIFYNSDEARAYKELSEMIEQNKKLSPEEKTEMYKRLDIIKGEL